MAKLLTTIPSLAFPHELDTLRISATAATHFGIEHQGIPFRTTLSPNSSGNIVVANLANYFREVISSPTSIIITLHTTPVARTTLIPARWDVPMTAAEFCEKHFLSAAPQHKTTHPTAQETVSWLTDTALPTITAQWITPSGCRSTTHTPTTSITTTGITTADCSPATLSPPSSSTRLLSYTLTVGKRTMHFSLPPKGYTTRSPISVEFDNIFGVRETFHFFGTLIRQHKATYIRAQILNVNRTLRVDDEELFQANTGHITHHDAQRLSDLIAARRAWHNKRAIVITDSSLKEAFEPTAPQTASLTWKYAAASRTVDIPSTQSTPSPSLPDYPDIPDQPLTPSPPSPPSMPQGIFDDSFDSTFE